MSGTQKATTPLSRELDEGRVPAGSLNHPGTTGDTIDLFQTNAGIATPADPNESVELRDVVSVAISYFERGMIDDAEELLREALSSGYSRSDALELEQRIRTFRGESQMLGARGAEVTASAQVSPDQFTVPLPGIDSQPLTVRRAVADADNDIAAGRLHSAHDATLTALALAPTYLPNYIRLAELRVALGDQDGAATILSNLTAVMDLLSDDGDWLTLSMRVILDPADTDALMQLARSLLGHRGTIQLEPYVPDAIERTLGTRPDAALELARDYLRLRPNDETVHRLFARSLVAAGDVDEVRAVLKRDVSPTSPADLLYLRSAVAYGDDRQTWLGWLERAVARVLAHPVEYAAALRAIDAARAMLPAAQHGLSAAVIRLAGGETAAALETLGPWTDPPRRDTSDTREMLVAACARAFALRAMSPIDSIDALCHAVGQAVVIDVRPFAEACRLFAQPISAEALMRELVAVAGETKQHELAIQYLEALRDRLPEHLEIRTGLADLQIAAGRVGEGIRELRYIAEKYERAGNIERMVEAMRHISGAVPNNAELKAKLIDTYVQRGVPDEAVRELGLLGEILLKRGKSEDAAAAFTRAAEIAATTGNRPVATEMFDRAVNTAPDNVGIRHAAVAFSIMSGLIEKATQQLWELVRITLQEQEPDEAVAALHQIIGLSPTDAAAYHRLGEVLTSMGEYAQAERVYRRLAMLTPDDPVLAAKQSALAALASAQ